MSKALLDNADTCVTSAANCSSGVGAMGMLREESVIVGENQEGRR